MYGIFKSLNLSADSALLIVMKQKNVNGDQLEWIEYLLTRNPAGKNDLHLLKLFV